MKQYKFGFIVGTAINASGMFLSDAVLEFMIAALICAAGYAIVDSIIELKEKL